MQKINNHVTHSRYFILFIGMVTLLTLFFHSAVFARKTPFGERPEVQTFINEMIENYQFDHDKLTTLFNSVKIQPVVFHNLDHPHEENPWYQYKKIFLTDRRIQKGVEFWHNNKKTLARAEKKFGVPANIIVAIIGIESYYGERTGKYSVLNTLSNITFNYHKRTKFFRAELSEFLLFCREHKLNPHKILGSYAGAIGQPQFMPSSFRHYAIDFDHSGTIDISHDNDDIIGSIANYLKEHGWQRNQPMMIKTKLYKHIDEKLFNLVAGPNLPIKNFNQYGIMPLDKISSIDLAGIVKLQKKQGYEYWIALPNFFAITHYNTHVLYAVATYYLSEQIREEYDKKYPDVSK